jgi:Cu+-exporting ATPase
MSHTTDRSRLHAPQQEIFTTTCFISNLHCPSCVAGIRASLNALDPRPEDIFVSIVSHSVVVRHVASLAIDHISASLEAAGFEIHSIFQNKNAVCDPVEVKNVEQQSWEWYTSWEEAVSRWIRPEEIHDSDVDMRRRQLHVAQCEQCKKEGGGVNLDMVLGDMLSEKPKTFITTSPKASFDDSASSDQKSPVTESLITVDCATSPVLFKATLAITGMTCSSCTSAITHAVEQLPYVQSININLLTHTGVIVFDGKHWSDDVVSTIEDCGFDVLVEKLEEVQIPISGDTLASKQRTERWRATYAIGGMTCSRCSGFVTDALKQHSWIEQVDVNLVSNTAVVLFVDKEHLPEIKETIEDVGYDATLDQVVPENASSEEIADRSVTIRVEGMYCHHCPQNILRKLYDAFSEQPSFAVIGSNFSLQSPTLHIKYLPESPSFTIRDIFNTIANTNPAFTPSVFHPPTIEERAREMHALERKRILFRLILCVIVAIPTFVLGIVFMSLISSKHPIRKYLMGTGRSSFSQRQFTSSLPILFTDEH